MMLQNILGEAGLYFSLGVLGVLGAMGLIVVMFDNIMFKKRGNTDE